MARDNAVYKNYFIVVVVIFSCILIEFCFVVVIVIVARIRYNWPLYLCYVMLYL